MPDRRECSWLPFGEARGAWAVQLTVLPPVEELQTDPQTRAKWIDYSAYDAKATWQLAQALKKQLKVSSVLTWVAHYLTPRQENEQHPYLCLMRVSLQAQL